MDFLLKAKNWQIFILLVVLPLFLMIGILRHIDLGQYWADINLGILIGLYYFFYMSWNFKIIEFFNERFEILSSRQIKLVKLGKIGAIIYGIYLILPLSLRFSNNMIMLSITPIVMMIGFFTIIYTIFCTSKTLKTMQHREDTRTGDIVIEMILIFYLPFGIWWIQKRVNKYFYDFSSK